MLDGVCIILKAVTLCVFKIDLRLFNVIVKFIQVSDVMTVILFNPTADSKIYYWVLCFNISIFTCAVTQKSSRPLH